MKRTNVGIRPEHVAKLRAIAAGRGERGYAKVLGEAIEAFIAAQASAEANRRAILDAAGSITPEEADEMLAEVRKRKGQSWRSSSTRPS